TAHVREFVGLGFETGAHTVTHPILSTLSDEDARREIAHSRSVLESITDKEVRLFAYPNGRWAQDFDLRHRDIARACGFDAAFSTEPGVSRQGADFWQLPRFTPWDRTSSRFALRMLSNCLAAHAARRD
ncbi:MAG TPA: polysaccharide deacetylase family protein, partial [Nitrospira sp.]